MSSSRAPSRTDGRLRSSLVALVVVSLLVGSTLVVGALAGAAVVLSVVAAEPASDELAVYVLLAAVVPTEAVYLAASMVFSHLRAVPVSVHRPTRRDVVLSLAGSVVAVAAASAIFAVGDAAGVSPVSSAFDPTDGADPSALLVLVPLSVLVVAPAEEAFFRGVVQGRLRRAFGPAASVTVASLLFAAVHAFNFASFGATLGLLVPLSAIFVASLVLGGVYETTDNLVVPVAVHGAYNATLALVSYLSVVGAV